MRRVSSLMVAVSIVAGCQLAPVARSPSPSASNSPLPSAAGTPLPSSTIALRAIIFAQDDEPALPEAREEVAIVALGQEVFVLAGYDAQGRDSNSTFIFDVAARQWRTGPALPLALNHLAAAVLEGQIYLAGGYRGDTPSGAVFALTAGRWERRASLHYPRGALGLVALDGRLYAVGGRGAQDEVGPAEAYDPGANAWRDLPEMPMPRDHVAAAAFRGRVCVAGGRFGSSTRNTARVDCWDPAAGAWVTLPSLPRPTSGATAGVLADRLLVLGGEESTAVIDLFAAYDGTHWESLGPMRAPRHGMGAAPAANRLYVCAGGNPAGLHAVATCTSITATPR
jgi:N-acetylneuraminic acid mutarotase